MEPIKVTVDLTKEKKPTYDIDDLISSLKLWGIILVDKPTAIPSAPEVNNIGNFTGRLTGSLFLPS